MLWRVRTNLPDRPGSLAALASACGAADVNILGLQIFPGVVGVTDELVLRTPRDWTADDLHQLVAGAGGKGVAASECSEAALVDQPTRYVRAARSVLAEPERLPEVLAALFDAGAGPQPIGGGGEADELAVHLDDVTVAVHRNAPFTATEHARASALAELVAAVLAQRSAAATVPADEPDAAGADALWLRTSATGVEALVGEAVVGRADLVGTDAVRRIRLQVRPPWRRMGIGTRLMKEAVRVARRDGVAELVLETRADDRSVLPMVLASGIPGRIRMSGDRLRVTIGLTDRTGARR